MTDQQTDFVVAYVMAVNYFGFIALMNLMTLELISGWFQVEIERKDD